MVGLAGPALLGCYRVEVQPAMPWHLPTGSGDCANLDSFRPLALAHASQDDREALASWAPPARPRRGQHEAVARVAAAYASQCGANHVAEAVAALVALPVTAGEAGDRRARALAEAAAWLKRFALQAGLSFVSYGADDAWEISLGSGRRRLRWLTHIDTAAPGDGWHGDPFVLRRAEGALWGRGVEANKGPLAAALMALSWLNQAGLRGDDQITIAIGNDGEQGGENMARYLRHAPPAEADIALDASFPLVIHASGKATWVLELSHPPAGQPSTPGLPTVVAVHGGGEGGPSYLPGTACMQVEAGGQQSTAAFAAQIEQAVAEENARRATTRFPVSVRHSFAAKGRRADIVSQGRGVHAASWEDGYNALWPLAQLAQSLHLGDRGAGTMLAVVARFLDQDPYGERLNLAASDPAMAPLTVQATAVHADRATSRLSLDVRHPKSLGHEALIARLARALATLQVSVNPQIRAVGPPVLREPWASGASADLVQTLLGVWAADSRGRVEPGKGSLATCGDTAARLLPKALAFGPLMPGRARTAGSCHESMREDDFAHMTRLVLAATLALTPPPEPPKPVQGFRIR